MVEINLFVVNVKNGRHTIRVVCFLHFGMLYALPKIMKYLENLDNLSLLYLFGIIIYFFILPLRKICLLSHGRGKFHQNLREKFQGELGPGRH